jgi:hypothetical protein
MASNASTEERAMTYRGIDPTDAPAGHTGVIPLSRESLPNTPEKSTNAGWTVKGIPDETIDITRMAARRRGMRIGAWVAETLQKAATVELEGGGCPESTDRLLSEKLDRFVEMLTREIHVLSEQNKAMDQELAVIRRGLLPTITGQKR